MHSGINDSVSRDYWKMSPVVQFLHSGIFLEYGIFEMLSMIGLSVIYSTVRTTVGPNYRWDADGDG